VSAQAVILSQQQFGCIKLTLLLRSAWRSTAHLTGKKNYLILVTPVEIQRETRNILPLLQRTVE
jgi:hypothetical protein